jgi:hypothetical protein
MELAEDTRQMHGRMAYPHSSMKGAGNVVVLLQSRAASKNLRQPELTDSALHVSNLSL